MADLTNSHTLTEFQRNAKTYIDTINTSKEPMLLTVNGKVQAVLIDPVSFQEMERQLEKERFLAAIAEGLRDIDEGRTRPIEEVYQEMKAKHGF